MHGGTSLAIQGEKLEGEERAPVERTLGGRGGFGLAQPGEVQDRGEVGAGGTPSSFLVLAILHLALPILLFLLRSENPPDAFHR